MRTTGYRNEALVDERLGPGQVNVLRFFQPDVQLLKNRPLHQQNIKHGSSLGVISLTLQALHHGLTTVAPVLA